MTVQDLLIAPGAAWSHAVGKFAGFHLPAPMLKSVISVYTKLLHVRMHEAAIPNDGFRTFGEFFTRDLRMGARPVDCSPGALVSPCDGVVQARGRFDTSSCSSPLFSVKGRHYAIQTLIERPGWWSSGSSGSYAVIYLSPADYHRVHSPVDGEVRSVWHLPGFCMPVNKLGQILAPWAIVRNERVVFDLATRSGTGVTLVMVGALAVRAIEVTLPGVSKPLAGEMLPVTIDRGDELGVFNLGSTVVMLWQGESDFKVNPGQKVLVGQKLAQL